MTASDSSQDGGLPTDAAIAGTEGAAPQSRPGAMRSALIEVWAKDTGRAVDCSVVVPVYNGARFLGDSIPSVLAQSGVVCDVVISDDCSNDGSLDAILGLVKAYSGSHSIRVYRTSRPAPSEHVPLLVGVSRSDRIIQAHQDDVSYPDRAMTLSAALTGPTKLVTSIARVRTASGISEVAPSTVAKLQAADNFPAYLRGGQGVMGGARYGMHRDVFDRFPALTWDRLSSGQDILLHLRAHILGGCKVIYTPLLTIGDHPERASYGLFDKQSPTTWNFDFALRRIVILSLALDELALVRKAGLVERKRARIIARQIRQARRSFVDSVVENRESAIREGFWISWIKWRVREN